MPRQRSQTIPIMSPTLLTRVGLLLSAVGAVAACQVEADATPIGRAAISPKRTAAQRFVRRPVQHALFTAKPTAPAAEAEAYFKANLLPALAADDRIGDVTVYVDASGAYIVQAELRTQSPANVSLALDVLSVGRSQKEAQALLAGMAKYFDVADAHRLTPRADLSVSRSSIGTVIGGAP